jgi:hypothetical protein
MTEVRYRLRAGERVSIAAPQETLDFIRTAKSRVVMLGGTQAKGFLIAPNVKGDQVLPAPPRGAMFIRRPTRFARL